MVESTRIGWNTGYSVVGEFDPGESIKRERDRIPI
jgi:hypothetical protein